MKISSNNLNREVIFMGEIADDIIEGIMCQYCGVYIGEPVGYPRSCDGCREYHESVSLNK